MDLAEWMVVHRQAGALCARLHEALCGEPGGLLVVKAVLRARRDVEVPADQQRLPAFGCGERCELADLAGARPLR
ncbi:hypothetical protein ABT237_22275 [Streptomyces sp. NPDC001581]|uniref:hypothetical protein n=1 Tax=Streptomyces sp. NPDC001581 TaxID=3154386 RepID=UPI0033277FA9